MPLTIDEMTQRIARCIGIWETNRGGNDPAPKESALDTVAGIHASMATIEQATMPYAIDAISRFSALRSIASPPLTTGELGDGQARCDGVVALLSAVNAAVAANVDPAKFVTDKASVISDSGLSNADVGIMFRAVSLKKKIDALNIEVTNKTKTVAQAIASIADKDRLGLGPASLSSYIKKPANWGENGAGWKRKSVDAMAGNVGGRIQAVCESSNGTALAIPVNKQRLTKQLGGKPLPDGKDAIKPIVVAVATLNNSNEKDYGENVWKNYDRLF